MEKHSPVIIIGAGPTGLALACWLHRHGVQARIIDKKAQATKTSNALGIQARTLEILNDLGLADEFINAGNKVRGANLHIAGKSVATIDLDNIATIYPFALILPQAKTETLLTQYLHNNGIEIERDCELTQLERHADGYHVKLKKAGDRYEQAACDWIVGCDGAHSKLRNLANIKFLGDDIDQPFIIADVDMSEHLDAKHIHTFFSPETALALFPISDKIWRIVSNAKQGYGKELTPEFIAELVEKRSNKNFIAESTSWTSSFWIHSKVVASMQGNHLFLAGDAAHIHSPLGGQGMNTGIQDAYNLAWKLALVINKKSPEKLLTSYHQERYPTVRQIVKATEKLTKLLLVRKSMMSRVRNFLLRRVLNKRRVNNRIATRMSQIAIHYQNSDIIRYGKHINALSPKVGKSFPYILANVKPELINILRTTQHIAFLFSGNTTERDSLNVLNELYTLFSDKYNGLITPYFVTPHVFNNQANNIIDSSLNIHKYFHAKSPAICILRPDKYIAYANHTLDPSDIQAFLNRLFL